MTDRTHPDSGRTTGGIVQMLHARIAELEAQLSSSGFTAADMATAAAQGFRDGVISVAASAGSEAVAWTTGLNWQPDPRSQSEMVVKLTRCAQPQYGFTTPLYTHHSPTSAEGVEHG